MLAPGDLPLPIVQAPMAGGPSTPALAAAVSEAGGLGFLAAGYKPATAVRDDVAALRAATAAPFGVNVFLPPADVADAAAVARYARSLGAGAGEPRRDDDDWEAKLALVVAERVPVVSFTFGCPPPAVVENLRRAGVAVWVTVTTAAEAREASAVDALVVQGVEAGGHRGSFSDAAPGDVGLIALLELVRAAVDLPLVAAGGLATGAGVAAVLAAGADAAQLGTAFMLCPEAGTLPAQRRALASDAPTALTRAFTGRTARGIVNRFLAEHPDAPSAYPEIHHVTAPLRASARERDDADGFNLWAGQAHALARAVPAGELTRALAEEAASRLAAARARAARR